MAEEDANHETPKDKESVMNYIEHLRARLADKLDIPTDLLDLYTLLAFVKGKETTLKDVHDAWSIWRNNTKPEHKSLIPFEELTPEIQELDRDYANAIISVSTHSL